MSSSAAAIAETYLISARVAGAASLGAGAGLQDLTKELSLGIAAKLVAQLSDATLFLNQFEAPPELQRATTVSARAWRLLLGDSWEKQQAARIDRISCAGIQAVAAASVAVLLTDEDERRDFELHETLPGSWPDGPTRVREQLYQTLAELHPKLPLRLQGAWDCVRRPGPDGASQAAHSLQELIDWTLRLAAPDEDVLRWHRTTGRDMKELPNRKPTRNLRAKYVLRDRPSEHTSARLFLRSMADLTTSLQQTKHGLHCVNEPIIGYLILNVESLLGFLLTDCSQGMMTDTPPEDTPTTLAVDSIVTTMRSPH